MAIEPESKVDVIGIHPAAFGPGKVVAALPAINMQLAPTVEIVGLQDYGWLIQIFDAFHTLVWERTLIGQL